MTSKVQLDMQLWLSDARGVYIPRDFALSFADRDACVSGVTAEQWATLEKGPEPENEWYWETWSAVEQNAVITMNGHKYHVHQSGDCWLIPDGMVYDEETELFKWPDEEEDMPETKINELVGKTIAEITCGRRGKLHFKDAEGKTFFTVIDDESLFDSEGNFFDTDELTDEKESAS